MANICSEIIENLVVECAELRMKFERERKRGVLQWRKGRKGLDIFRYITKLPGKYVTVVDISPLMSTCDNGPLKFLFVFFFLF